MTKMYSVTCPDDMGEFISDKNVSPSSIFQGAVQNLIETSKISEAFVKELQRKITGLQDTLSKQRDFIEQNGLMDKFLGLIQNV